MDAENGKPRSEDVELWLDSALRVRADIEPRLGLEDRVLARLATEAQRKAFACWQVLAAVTTVLAMAAALVILQSRTQKSSKQQTAPSTARQATVQAANVAPQVLSPHSHPALSSTPDKRIRRSVRHEPRSGTQEPLPKLATFPSSRPESAEEHMLARLAARRGSFDLANAPTELVPLKDLSVPELKIFPMEGTPPDNTPEE